MKENKRFLRRYFHMNKEIPVVGTVTDPLQAAGALVVTTTRMSLMILRRNEEMLRLRSSCGG